MDFNTGGAFGGGVPQPTDNAPYLWDFNSNSLGRWPTNLAEISQGDSVIGYFQPSPDFSHLALSSNNVAFAPGGISSAPGSAYDDSVVANSVVLISKMADGESIPQQPSNTDASEIIRFPQSYPSLTSGPTNSDQDGLPVQDSPAVSTNGSHILMSTGSTGPLETFRPRPSVVLYMRVNDAVTYEVSQGHDVNYLGMSADGSKVYFTSSEQLTTEDQDNSTDLYMWNEKSNSLTLISKGVNGTGNTDACIATWTTGCGVVAVATRAASDNSIAAESGDVFFYSPEQLDGSNGVPGLENLYDYHGGRAQYVASFEPNPICNRNAGSCVDLPITRIQVSPSGAHAAFVTAQRLTSYDNFGVPEMYSYDPSTETLLCVSCNPRGAPPAGEVTASADGLFMANDGRTFFNSPDALSPNDTNNLSDVYEYVDGRPQLITTGTGGVATEITPNQERSSGLEGVSADGINVYFSTFDTLVGQDDNGSYLKFYDARTNGGFPFVPPAAPCAAADECHGAGSTRLTAPTDGTGADLGSGGNAAPVGHRHRHRKTSRRRRHRRSPSNG